MLGMFENEFIYQVVWFRWTFLLGWQNSFHYGMVLTYRCTNLVLY